jgi:hypothetical protein
VGGPAVRPEASARAVFPFAPAVLAVALVFGFSLPARAQETRATSAAIERAPATMPADPIAELRTSTEPYLKLHGRIDALWKANADAARERLLKLVREPGLKPNVLLALGWVCAEQNQRSVLDVFLAALRSTDLTKPDLDRLREFVLLRFHFDEPILVETETWARASVADEKGFEAAMELVVYLVDASRGNATAPSSPGREGKDRLAALEALTNLWATAAPPEKSALLLRATASRICGGNVDFADAAAWRAWIEHMKARVGTGNGIAIEDVLADVVESQKAEIASLRATLETELGASIRMMASTGVAVPARYLSHPFPSIRELALKEISNHGAVFPEKSRAAAIDELLAGLATLADTDPGFEFCVRALGVLARHGGEAELARREKVSEALLARCDGDRAAAVVPVLDALLDVGTVKEAAPLLRVYERALGKSVSADWTAVRLACVRAAQVTQGGSVIARRGLTDPDPRIRGAAAVAYEALAQGSERPGGSRSTAEELVAAALAESDQPTRQRMLESLRTVVQEHQSALAAPTALRLARAVAGAPEDVRGVLISVLSEPLKAAVYTEETEAALLTAAAAVLSEGPGSESCKLFLTLLVQSRTPESRRLLGEWIVGEPSVTEGVEPARAALIADTSLPPQSLWDLAERVAAKRQAEWYAEAVALGRAALRRNAPASDGGRDLEGDRRDRLAGWQSLTADKAEWMDAREYLTRRLEKAPDDARLLLARSQAEERLERWVEAEADLAKALARGPLPDDAPAASWRRLARLRFRLGRFTECLEALTAAGEPTLADQRLSLLAALLGPERHQSPGGIWRTRVDDELAARDAEWLETVRALGNVLSLELADHRPPQAAASLPATSPDSRPAAPLRDLVASLWESDVRVAGELEAHAATGDPAALAGALRAARAVDELATLVHALARLRADVDARRPGAALWLAALQASCGDIMEVADVRWPTTGELADERTAVSALCAALKRRPLPAKIIAACLNG